MGVLMDGVVVCSRAWVCVGLTHMGVGVHGWLWYNGVGVHGWRCAWVALCMVVGVHGWL